MMNKLDWKSILVWLLAAFFIVGGSMNIFASSDVVADYERWGYPGWFHYITGALELSAAALLLRSRTRLPGAVLASLVMAGAAVTVLWNGEFSHSLAPLAVLAVAVLVGYLNRAGVPRRIG